MDPSAPLDNPGLTGGRRSQAGGRLPGSDAIWVVALLVVAVVGFTGIVWAVGSTDLDGDGDESISRATTSGDVHEGATGRGTELTAAHELARVPADGGAVSEADYTDDLDTVPADSPFDCARGHLPLLEAERFPDDPSVGADTPEAALKQLRPDLDSPELRPLHHLPDAPVWIDAGDETLTARRFPEAGWIAFPVTFHGCLAVQDAPLGHP